MMIHEFGYKVFMINPALPFLPCETLGNVLKSIMKLYYRANKTLFHPIWHFTLTYAKSYFLLASWQFQI